MVGSDESLILRQKTQVSSYSTGLGGPGPPQPCSPRVAHGVSLLPEVALHSLLSGFSGESCDEQGLSHLPRNIQRESQGVIGEVGCHHKEDEKDNEGDNDDGDDDGGETQTTVGSTIP